MTYYPSGFVGSNLDIVDTYIDPATQRLVKGTTWAAANVNPIIAEIDAIQDELGANPKGSYASVKERLDSLNTAQEGHSHGNITNSGKIGSTANLPVITTTSGVVTTGSFGSSANTFCQGNDSRLSDARTPTSHSHAQADVTNLTTDLAGKANVSHTHGNVTNAGAIGSTANLPVITATSGMLTVGSFGVDANTFCQGNDSRLYDARTPISHVHGNISNVGAIGSTADLPVKTTTSGVLTTGSFGTTSGTFCQGNDSRLSDARTPVAHTHVGGDVTSVVPSAAYADTVDGYHGAVTATANTAAIRDANGFINAVYFNQSAGIDDAYSADAYFYQQAGDGYLRKKSLAAVKTEVVTKAAIETVLTGQVASHSHIADGSHTHTVSALTDITATATELNYTDGVTSNIQTQLDAKSHINAVSYTLPATSQYYRIAVSSEGIGRCYGKFIVDWWLSGYHGVLSLEAGCMYGQGAMVNQLGFTKYGTSITHARIVYNPTYTGNYAYLEVYNSTATALGIQVRVYDSMGWTLYATPTAGLIPNPSGYYNKTIELTPNGLVGQDGVQGTYLMSAFGDGGKGFASLGANRSIIQVETNTGISREYFCGPDASTYGKKEFYRATSTTPTKVMDLNADGSVSLAGALGVAGTATFTETPILSKAISSQTGTGNGILPIRITSPGGGAYATTTSPQTGAIKITLPQSWTSTMVRFTVKIYEYTTNESFEVHCGGYTYIGNPSWVNVFAYIVGAQTNRNFSVRFGHDGSKCCVYIGELASVWLYPQVFVTDVELGYTSATIAQWDTGWVVGFEASAFGAITQTISNCQVGKYVEGNLVWHAGNDGSGSTLDADKLDALESTDFFRATKVTAAQINTVTLPPGYYNVESETITGLPNNYNYIIQMGPYSSGGYPVQIACPYESGVNLGMYYRTAVGSTWGSWEKILSKYVLDANGNICNIDNKTIDATTVDGYNVAEAATVSTVVARTVNGYINAVHFNQSAGIQDSYAASSYFYEYNNDGYLRKKSPSAVKTELVTKAAIEAALTGAITTHSHTVAASGITNTPSGNIVATDVQAAINELDTEKQSTISTSLTAKTSADTTFTSANNWMTGVSVSLGAGTYFIVGQITMYCTNALYSGLFSAGLFTGSTIRATGHSDSVYCTITLTATVTLDSTTTVYLKGATNASSYTYSRICKAISADSTACATQINALKIA